MDMQEMGSGLPAWLTTLSWVYIALCVASAAAVLYDIHGRGHRQPHRIMEAIWPLSALYLGPFALPVYRRFGRTDAQPGGPDASLTATTVRSGLPGGVSSGLAHIVAVPFVVATGLTLAGMDMWAMVAIIAVLAIAMLFVFEYTGLRRSARSLAGSGAAKIAALAAVVTVVAFDLGMLGWMLVLHYTENMPGAGDVRFTFLMQIGLVLGSLTAYPAVRWLVARKAAATV